MVDRKEWEQRLARYQGLYLLFEADDNWGPMADAVRRMEGAFYLCRRVGGAEAEAAQADYEKANDRQARELDRHMDEIWNPVIQAGLALVLTPAPDLDAVRIKHEACSSVLMLTDNEDVEGDLFRAVQADVRRLIDEPA